MTENEIREAVEKIVGDSMLAGYAKNKGWEDELVEELMELINGKENKMGKICPQCNYHFPEIETYYTQPPFDCQHDFYVEVSLTQSAKTTKWRCKKCLETKYTYD